MKSTAYVTFLILLIATAFTSCYKKQATVAVIHVEDSNGSKVGNARVILYGSGNQGEVVLRDTLFTNSDGKALFNYDEVFQSGQAGVAVLDIEVTKNGATAYGIIKVEQEETSEEKVIL